MIWESHYWKRDLARFGRVVESASAVKDWDTGQYLKVEKSVMLGCFVVRKLSESGKMSDAVAGRSVEVKVWPLAPALQPPTLLSHDQLERFDPDSATSATVRWLRVCDLVIHSLVFVPVWDEPDSTWLLAIASDRSRSREATVVRVTDFAHLFREVARDGVSRLTWERLDTGEERTARS